MIRGLSVLLPASLLVAGLLLGPHRLTFAQASPINPSLFRLPDGEFPKGSSPTSHQVETNDLLANEGGIVHFGPSFVDEGRETGYFQAASQVVTVSNATYAVETYFLVSIFDSPDKAQAAFGYQVKGYEALRGNHSVTVDSALPSGVGDPNEAAMYTVTPADGGAVRSELFFSTGPVLAEVWQSYTVGYPNVNDAQIVQAQIAGDLDAIARSAPQSAPVSSTPATSTPTPEPTSTDTGEPTSTPEPTATGTPESSIQLSGGGSPVAGCGSDYYACATPTPTTPLVFDNFVVRAEPMGPDAAYNLRNVGLSTVKLGATVNLAVYFTLRNVPPQSYAVVEFRVQRGYGVHFFAQKTIELATTPNTYRVIMPFTEKSVGQDVFTARVAIDGDSREAAAHFHVVRFLAPAPSTPGSGGKIYSGPKAPSASASLQPQAFALSSAAFPRGSQVRTSRVESNQQAAGSLVPHLGTQSFASLGRQTGYYVDTVQANNGHAIYTQYLVSIFATPSQATSAFNQQRDGYIRLSRIMPGHYTSAVSHLGVGQSESFGTSLLPVSGKPFYTREQYFVRGRVLAEVVQSYFVSDSHPYGHNAKPYLYSLARALDARARTAR